MMNYGLFNPNIYPRCHGAMRINGVGILNVEPNMATVILGVITENISLKVAQKENTLKSMSLIKQLYEMNIPKEKIKTVSYDIQPQYDFIDGKQVFRGYRVANMLSVTIKDLTTIGEVIDKSTASGANSVSNITFSVDNPSLYYNKALNLAITNAITKATDASNKLGVNLNKIPYKIIEESYSTINGDISLLKFNAVSTPILPGEINITAKIQAIFSYQ